MKKILRHSAALVLALVLCLAAFGAVLTVRAEEESEAVSVRMMYWNKQDTMQSFLDLVEEKLPHIDLEFHFVPVGEIDSILSAQLQSGEGPDIVPSGENEAYVKAGFLLDLTEQDFMNNFEDSARDLISIDGKQYGIPGLSWYEGMFYNKEIFEENDIEVPTNFDELMDVHKQLTEKGIKPQAMGAASWEPMMKSTLGFATAEWLRITDDGKGFDQGIRSGERTFVGSELENLIPVWSQYIEDGYITPEMLEVSYDEALVEFATGGAAMWESGPWAVSALLETNPDLQFDMFPFYGTQEGGDGWLIGGPGVSFGINSSSKNQEAALEVLALMSSEEGQLALLNDNPGSGSFIKNIEIELPEYFQGVKDVLSSGRTYCPWFVWSANNSPYIETYGKGLQEYLQGNMTVEEILEQVDEVAEADRALQ